MMRFTIALSLLLVQVASAANVENSQKVSNKLESFLEAAPKKVDLSKPMPLKAQEQGFSGKPVQHKNMKTHTADWRREYGPKTAPTATQHSGSMQCSAASAAVIIAAALLHFAQ